MDWYWQHCLSLIMLRLVHRTPASQPQWHSGVPSCPLAIQWMASAHDYPVKRGSDGPQAKVLVCSQFNSARYSKCHPELRPLSRKRRGQRGTIYGSWQDSCKLRHIPQFSNAKLSVRSTVAEITLDCYGNLRSGRRVENETGSWWKLRLLLRKCRHLMWVGKYFK